MKVIPIRPEVGVMANDGRGEFFAVGRDTFLKACELGMNAATTYLVQACGTGPAQKNTSWSATAAEKYTGLGWNRANDAIKALTKKRICKRTDDGANKRKPRYELAVKGDLIWLPRTIIESANGEMPPIKKVRQTQDVMTLRLFIELYYGQNLRDDGGISRDVSFLRYERHEYGGRAEFTVWAFDRADMFVTWGDISRPHRREPTEAEQAEGKNAGADFFARWHTLQNLGLIEWIPYLFEGKDGEPLHALDDADLSGAMYEAACGLLSQSQVDGDCYDYLIPAYHHMQGVQVYGIGRLRYRPRTRATSAGWAKYQQQRREYLTHYRAIASRHITAEAG